MLFEELNELVETEKAAIEFALRWKLLPEKHVICPVCNIGNVGWYKRSHEGLKIPYALRCSRKKCRKKWSVTKNTWFFGSHLSVRQNILLIYCWIRGDTVGETSEILKLSKSTVMDYYQFCREVCYTIVSNWTKPIGGHGDIVRLSNYTIDKVVDKQKKVVHFLEGVNLRTEDCFLVEVHSKESSTYVYLIKRFIRPGSRVTVENFTEFLRIKDSLEELALLDIKFEDDRSDDSPEVHPSQPKCLWKCGKKSAEDEDAKTKDFVLFQYLYFHPLESMSTGEKFERFLNDVAKVYPGPFKISLTPVIY